MDVVIHNRKKRIEARRRSAIESAIAIVEAVANDRIDAYEGWQQVNGIFQANAGLGLHELKQFVQLEGIDANSTLSVTEDVRDAIRRNAVRFLAAR